MILAGVALIAGAGCGGEQARDPSPAPSAVSRIGEVERVLRDRVALLSEGTVTGVITLVRVGDETRVVTVGLADAAAKEPMRPGDTFPIASVTKPMVATAVLQQVESGKLTLDDTVEKWLPGIVAKGDRMTIRQLLSHRSGVHEPQSLDELPPLDKLTDRDIVKILGAKPLDFEPGTTSGYSNVGYILLGMILEKVTGASIGEVLDSSIFDPAGMDDSVLAPKHVGRSRLRRRQGRDSGYGAQRGSGRWQCRVDGRGRRRLLPKPMGREPAVIGPGRADEQTRRRPSPVRWRVRARSLDDNV